MRKNVSRRRDPSAKNCGGANRIRRIGTRLVEEVGSGTNSDEDDDELVLEDWRQLVTSTQRFLQFQRGNTAEHYAKTKPRMMGIELKEKARRASFGGGKAKAAETAKTVTSNGTAGRTRKVVANAKEAEMRGDKKEEGKGKILNLRK